MTPGPREAIVTALVALLNLCVPLAAWSVLGLFSNLLPPLPSILVMGLSIAALYSTVWVAAVYPSRPWWRRSVLPTVLAATLLTVLGQSLMMNGTDEHYWGAVFAVPGVLLHLLLTVLLGVRAYLAGHQAGHSSVTLSAEGHLIGSSTR